ncbi:hypothetical protein [Sorangium sp. So ce513]|uniref:hypothetical protein n=1 Tax=Sorangium sp. So ce513 TaxID=3133315 RepID=UPI003F61A7CB
MPTERTGSGEPGQRRVADAPARTADAAIAGGAGAPNAVRAATIPWRAGDQLPCRPRIG